MTLPSTETLLHKLGWDDGWEAAFADHRAAGLVPARVAIQHRGAYDLIAEAGEARASATTRLFKSDELPVVGDWVGYDPATNLVEAVLDRRTSISRKEVMHASREQVLAANIDVAFLVQALPLDFNVRRLERYLAMAWESGAQPVVLLTKTDLVDDTAPYLDEVEAVTLGSCPTLAVSAKTGDGLEQLRPWLEPNRTAVLLGSSGVGKSTIVNALVGEELLATNEVREDDHAADTRLAPRADHPRGRRRHPRHAGDPRAAALGRRPRADVQRRRGDRAQLSLLRLQPRPGARLRDPCGARRRLAGRRPVAVVREAAARARGGRGTAEPPTATRARCGSTRSAHDRTGPRRSAEPAPRP